MDEPPSYSIEINNAQTGVSLCEARIRRAISLVLHGEHVPRAELSVAIVDDPTIHDLNRRFLQHDYPTDVITFPLEDSPEALEGEIILSADTAMRESAEQGWPVEQEIALYAIHGTLHLTGYDDHTEHEIAAMRAKETFYLEQLARLAPPEQTAQSAQPSRGDSTQTRSPC